MFTLPRHRFQEVVRKLCPEIADMDAILQGDFACLRLFDLSDRQPRKGFEGIARVTSLCPPLLDPTPPCISG